MFMKWLLFALHGFLARADLPLLHPADSIEFYSSLQFCKNSSVVIKEKELEFSNCLSENVPAHPDLYGRACGEYKEEYIRCWDPVIQKSNECSSQHRNKGAPTIFKALLKSVCKDDMAQTFTNKFKIAVESASAFAEEIDQCQVFYSHGLQTCTDLHLMNSKNKCRKYSAINTCLERINCKGSSMAAFLQNIYRETGQVLGCANNKTRTVQRTGKSRRGSG